MKRLRSLDEVEPLPWHHRPRQRVFPVPMLLALLLVSVVGALVGWSL